MRKVLALSVAVLVCAFSVVAQTVVEQESKLSLKDSTAELELIVESSARDRNTPVELSILDPDGKIVASHRQLIDTKPGKQRYKIRFGIGDLLKNAGTSLAWHRLQYRVAASSDTASFSELLQDDFDLRAAAFSRVVPGEPFRVRVRGINPFTERPVRDIDLTITLTLEIVTESDDDEIVLTAKAKTNRDGTATVDLKIPKDIKLDDDPELKIVGQKNGIVREIETDIDEDERRGSVFLTQDKPLYQPGQTFNVRGLMFDANNTIVANAELEFSIEDEDSKVVFREKVTTSEFGIAAISWQIPDNAKLGTYRVAVEADDDLEMDSLDFKVSRYDLPNFSVTAKPDRPFYLPSNRTAEISINADYLFGKPVTDGKVRVVAEKERRWNYREQKYDIDEGRSVEGTTNGKSTFVAKFDLNEELDELLQSSWRRFMDLSLTAYFTDLTTNRTEQRRFDIRLTKEPIHVYLIRNNDYSTSLPATAYVSTFYADGTPAVCNVEVTNGSGRTIARTRSNSLGAGKIEISPNELADVGDRFKLKINAKDRNGQIGTFEESLYISKQDVIRITTDKTIYKPGEVIEIELEATRPQDQIYVDILKDGLPIDGYSVRLNKGKARLSVPYRPTFGGELMLAAYSDRETNRWSDQMRATRGIIFPEQQNLIVSATFGKKEYRPSEDATVRFSVTDGSRKPVFGAIGLSIFDKAIEERARTESEFGGYFRRFSRLMGYERSFGSVTVRDLNNLDLSRPVSPEMELAAEIMLASGNHYPSIYHSGNLDKRAREIFAPTIAATIEPIKMVLRVQYGLDGDHPIDRESLVRILDSRGVRFDDLRDPWGQQFVVKFSTERARNLFVLSTAGPDKSIGTADDFEVFSTGFEYFNRTGQMIDDAIRSYHVGTGQFVRSMDDLDRALANAGLNAMQLRDRWGRPYVYEFGVEYQHFSTRVISIGPNGVREPETWRGDDFQVWRNLQRYFAETEGRIQSVLRQEINEKRKPFPRSIADFTELLRNNGIDLSLINDGYGRPVYVSTTTRSNFSDRTKVANGKTTITPVTEEILAFNIRSRGADGIENSNDFSLAAFSSVISETSAANNFVPTEITTTTYTGPRGAIRGTVVDQAGAVISGATVTAIDQSDTSKEFETETDATGLFLLDNLPSGTYRVLVTAIAFRTSVVANVVIRSQVLVEMVVSLEVGSVSASVEVTASSDVMNTTSSSVSTNVSSKNIGIQFTYAEQTSTPRLREYFPETLFWQPEVVTDKGGRASVNFKMGDNITTWRMFAIASTKNGKVGVVEKEVTAFQPFFADLDPPKFLTVGDEIDLPVQIRNYTDKRQNVGVTMARSDWFSLLGSDSRQVAVDAGRSENAVFGFRADTAIREGKQRVTAIARGESDAIEKGVTVRPNGQEIVRTESRIFSSGETKHVVNFPSNALPKTQQTAVKIYPNLFSHVAESVEGLLRRPYGCGEQTVSSTYPNLMVIRYAKPDSPIAIKAKRFLANGYERLLGYQVADGGFSYWGGKDSSDIALTAYALRFLNDAASHIDVDENVVERAERWLVSQQAQDGSWTKTYRWETNSNPNRSKLLTTYVARSMAMRKGADADGLKKALTYLRARNNEIDEPYAMALFGLASLDAGDKDTAVTVARQLERMAIAEGDGVFWKLETNTPFYGWGTAGRIETTALVLQLLYRTADDREATAPLIEKALIFLLKNKDRYGVWFSTQTTINVLDAFLLGLGDRRSMAERTVEVLVNGVSVERVSYDPDRIVPIDVDVASKLNATENTVEIRSSANSTIMSHVVATHYIDWRDADLSGKTTSQSRALRLDLKCDKTATAIMDEITCSTSIERVGSSGYGMLLAEIGTPPGADVSRESLERAIANDWSISRYEILPDRVVLYLWARAGGTNFSFTFRPRYGINAQTPSSVVYDYYNPEAQAIAAPLRFMVK